MRASSRSGSPSMPLWIMSLALLLLMTATNLYSVTLVWRVRVLVRQHQGRRDPAPFWCWERSTSSVSGPATADFSNLTEHGGFFPNGIGAVFSGIVVVIFSMVGAEIATIAAAESAEPERAIVKATNSVIFRIMIFYIGSIFLLAVDPAVELQGAGPFPFCRGSGKDGHHVGPPRHERGRPDGRSVVPELRSLHRIPDAVRSRGAPGGAGVGCSTSAGGAFRWPPSLSSTVIGYLCVIAAYVSPDTVFLFLLNSSGAIILFVYLMIRLSQLVLRPKDPPERLRVKMWFYPAPDHP